MKPNHLTLLAIFICCLLSVTNVSAQLGEQAGEIWINKSADPDSDPNNPHAAVDPSGRSIFVWDGTPSSTRKEIFLRIYPADGGAPGDPVQVNTLVENAQHAPRIAVRNDGSFLVVWNSDEPFNPPEQTFLREMVRSQAFDANGNPIGGEQLLSTLKPGLATGHTYVSPTVLTNGDYMVVWRSSKTPEVDDTSVTIQGRRVGADGQPIDGQFQINSTKSSAGEHYPAVTHLVDGGFLVAWTYAKEVYGRRFAANGMPLGDDFQINTLAAGATSWTELATNEDGRVIVVWEDAEESGENGTEIRGRMFSPDLDALGNDFRINTLIAENQEEPAVASYGESGFFVVWHSWTSAGPDSEPRSIEGRIVSGNNEFASGQFLVNKWTETSQHIVGIGGRNGRAAIAWHSQSNPETSNNVINGQLWSICGIFCDSFEGQD